MEPLYQTTFSKAVLTGVFTGFVTTLLCMIFYLVYKDVTGFSLSFLINVSSLIFLINVLFLAVGVIYYWFVKYFKKGDLIYIILFVLITVVSVWGETGIHRADDQLLNFQFHQLFGGLIIIIGIAAFAGIPILYHNKKFNDNVI